MIATLYIDGHDVFVDYGIFITEGGYNGLLSFPSLKEPDKTDWAERDGIEVDLLNPVLNAKKFSVSFAVKSNGDFNGLMALIFNQVYHTFNFAEVGLIKSLRVVSCSDFKGTNNSLRFFSLEFSDDFPLSAYSYQVPVSTQISQRGYELDSNDFSKYGVAILEGSDAEILKPNAVKPNLTVNVKYVSGETYSNDGVVFQSKDVKLKCLLLATNISEFWRNYNALLFDLSKSGLRTIYYSGLGYKCHYKSSSVSRFDMKGRIWCEFEISLVFTKLGVQR